MAQEPEQVGQDEIERLLRAKPAAPATAPPKPIPSGGGDVLNQDEIEDLLSKPGRAASDAAATKTESAPRKPAARELVMAAGDAEFLLRQAEEALASVDAPRLETTSGLANFKFEEFGGAPASTDMATLELIRDVELDVRIELGRAQMYLEDVLRLRRGSVVALDKLAGDPVDIFVNGRLVARGEVLVLNENFCVRVNELVAAQASRAG